MNEELESLRRFHALFATKRGDWAGTIGARISAEEQGTDIWSVWRAATDAQRGMK